MNNIAKKKLRKIVDKLFNYVKNNKIYKQILKLHFSIRIVFFGVLFGWFIIWTILLPPIPFWNISLVLWLVIIFPLKKVRSKTHFFITKFRVTKIYANWLLFKHKFKNYTR